MQKWWTHLTMLKWLKQLTMLKGRRTGKRHWERLSALMDRLRPPMARAALALPATGMKSGGDRHEGRWDRLDPIVPAQVHG